MAKLDKLEVLFRRAKADVDTVCPIISDLLGIPTGERYLPLELTPVEKRTIAFQALIGQLAALATQRPLLVTVEDAHWFDPTSIELIEWFIERIKILPVLLVITFRPEFAPRWTHMPHVTSLALSQLAQNEGATLIDQLTGGRSLPPEVRIQILGKTDGIPLFVEELTKAVLDLAAQRRWGAL